jgi:hypothetical protein
MKIKEMPCYLAALHCTSTTEPFFGASRCDHFDPYYMLVNCTYSCVVQTECHSIAAGTSVFLCPVLTPFILELITSISFLMRQSSRRIIL